MVCWNTYLCVKQIRFRKEIAKRGTSFGALGFNEKKVRMYKNVTLFFGKEAQKDFQGEQIFETFDPNRYE